MKDNIALFQNFANNLTENFYCLLLYNKYVIPLINEAFKTNYSLEEDVFVDEENGIFFVKDKAYFFVFNLLPNDTVGGLLLWDELIGQKYKEIGDFIIPESAIIQMITKENVPTKANAQIRKDDQVVYENVPIMLLNVFDYDVDDIISKGLDVLFPLYLLKYEFFDIALEDDISSQDLLTSEVKKVFASIDNMCSSSSLLIVETVSDVIAYLTASDEVEED